MEAKRRRNYVVLIKISGYFAFIVTSAENKYEAEEKVLKHGYSAEHVFELPVKILI